MAWLTNPEAWVALATLTALEIVLGIDNIVFISIVAGRLPEPQRARARYVGLVLAMVIRIGLLMSIKWMMSLTAPVFRTFGNAISGRDIVLIAGGLFLLAKSTHEIHARVEGGGEPVAQSAGSQASFWPTIIQILLLDIVFSLDSVITAVGMVDDIGVMITAVIIAVVFMLVFAGTVSAFVDRRPTIKMLALSFLLLIGVALIADGFDQHIPKGYIYFAMAFSLFVETLNLRAKAKEKKKEVEEAR